MKNYYEILEVNENASKEVIEKVYKVLAKKYHPDMHQGTDKIVAEEKFKETSEAYEILMDDEKRKAYDEELKYEKQQTEKVRVQTIYKTVPSKENNNSITQEELIDLEKQLQYEREKAYNDAYIKSLKDMGYNIVYKKTFKDYMRGFVVIAIIILILAVAWFFPPTNKLIIDWYNTFPDFIKSIINSIINIFK